MDVTSSIITAIQLIIANAPKIFEAVTAAKNFITGLFGAGVIDEATQNALHTHVDELAIAAITGQVPPQWTVEPDPKG